TEPVSTEPLSSDPVSTEPEAEMAEPVLSWTSAEAPGTIEAVTTIILSPAGQAFEESESAPADTSESAFASTDRTSMTGAGAGAASTGNGASSTVPNLSPNDVLMRALLAGAGVRAVDIPGGVTPQLMNQLGR